MAVYDEMVAAKKGYEAYAVSTGGKNYQGLDMPTWSNLPDVQKKAWVEAGAAIMKYCNDFLIQSSFEGK